jgi:hypothetical protein
VVASATAALLSPLLAHAQDPVFDYEKPEDVQGVTWRASAQAGVVNTSGNSQTVTASGGLTASRDDGENKLSLDVSGVYARSKVLTATDLNGSNTIDADNELRRDPRTTAKNWQSRLRYDRFLLGNNSLYLTGLAAADQVAGKSFYGGFQAGYSRHLFKNAVHDLTAELGYDLSYEDFTAGGDVTIHSLRAFTGYTAALNEIAGVFLSGEVLMNLNSENVPPGNVDAFDDTRFNARVGTNIKLYGGLSFRFSFMARYDNAPAPRPVINLPYAPGFVPLADKLDTITEAALIINFL